MKYKIGLIVVAVAFLFLLIGYLVSMKDFSNALYNDASYSVDDRVADLLDRMTTKEKIGQMALLVLSFLFYSEK